MPGGSRGSKVDAVRVLAASLRDTELPGWLRDSLDPAAVAAGLDARIGEVVPGALDLVDLRLLDARARSSWSLWFEADVVTAAGVRTVLLAGQRPVAPESGLTLSLVEGDRGLPALQVLTDPETARSLLESTMSSHRPGLELAAVHPRVVRHKPGRRATVVHRLEYAPGADAGWPRAVVSKTYRGDDGAATYAWMRALSDRRPAGVRLAEPLAWLEEQRTLVQEAIPGDLTLADLLAAPPADGSLSAALRDTADGLVALHACGVADGPHRTAAAELRAAGRALDRVAPSLPDGSRARAAELLDLLGDLVDEDPTTSVPVHGAFRPAQVLLDGRRPGFLDFDGFGRGEPAHDVGRFVARLTELAPGDGRGLATEFVERYRQGAALPEERLLRWVALDLAVGAVRSWYRGRPERARVLLGLLEDLTG